MVHYFVADFFIFWVDFDDGATGVILFSQAARGYQDDIVRNKSIWDGNSSFIDAAEPLNLKLMLPKLLYHL